MRIFSWVLCIWTMGLFVFFSFTTPYNPYLTPESVAVLDQGSVDPSETYKYTRFGEVKKVCGSVLSSASELKPDTNRKYSIKSELSIVNGDWRQETEGAPLMPFDGRDLQKDDSDHPDLLHLLSFWVANVGPIQWSKIMVNVSGTLDLHMSRNGTFSYSSYMQSPRFESWPGYSLLTISFEGVYIESEDNGGERVMCLLGSSLLPSRQTDSTDPSEWMKGSSSDNYQTPPLLQDDQILLILRYPITFSLTSRAIRGELRSLNQKSSLKYFDKVYISSKLGPYTNYHFGSQEIVSKACKPYPYQDDLKDSQIEIYKGYEFCGILERFTSGEGLTIVPNWKCNVTDAYCSKLGPFQTGKAINATDGGFQNVKLTISDLRCEPIYEQNTIRSARIFTMFRAVSPLENSYDAAQRTGLDNTTLSAEGIWNSSNGQLCMVGCLGLEDSAEDGCNSRVCLYVPISFTIVQRSIVFGSISSINKGTGSYFPISFEKVLHPMELLNRFETSHLSYKYSKIGLAGAFLERSEPFDFSAVIKKSLLSYPMQEGDDVQASLSLLSEDLTLHVSAVPDPLPKARFPRTSVQIEILSLGGLFGRYWGSNSSIPETKSPFSSRDKFTEKQLLLNVSADLTLTGNLYSNISVLFLEGLYNQIDGKMYLIGCRDVRASYRILFESMDLENGLDCLIELKVEYPPTTAGWLMDPTAKIAITSKRTEDDPLYFSPIKLMTLPILYRKQRETIISRKGVEGILRILTLSIVIACIFSQLFYIKDKVDSIPYISFVMLGVQALGYSIPLITGAETFFSTMASTSYGSPSYDLKGNQWFQVIDYIVKLLVLVAFLLTLRLFQKVWKSRIRLLTRTPLEQGRVPSDKWVFIFSLIIHAVGFLIILTVHMVNASQRPVRSDKYIDPRGNTHNLLEWEIELEEYIGLIQDFFLLPQIIGNILWQINCKPLRKAYYIGVTVVRLLPHVYDYIRAPVFNPYFSEEYEFVNPSLDFYSKFGDVTIPVTATVLAIIVYVQQRWSYNKLSQTLKSGRLMPLGSRVYERLPSKSFEAELVSGVNETATQDRLNHDSE